MMTTTMMTTTMTMTESPRQVHGSRMSAPLRIVGWFVLTAAVGLATLILIVNATQQSEVAHRANAQVEQELSEFRQFTAGARDPQTAEPFASVDRLFELYLSRQQPDDTELIIGRVANSPDWYEARGPDVQSEQFDVLEEDESTLLQRMLSESSGVTDTAVGEIRWGSLPVTVAGETVGTLAVAVYVEPLAQRVAGTTRLLIVVGLGSLALTALMSYVVAGQILRPVREVREAAAEITEQDLSGRIPVTGRDDVSELAVQFNAMLDRIEDAFAAEQRFVDDAGHELRTPITVIRGHLELLSEDPQERAATLALVTQELDRMSRIVTDLLALAKAERPDFLHPQPGVDLAALTLGLDARVAALGDRRWGLSHIAEGTCTVDPERLTQAVLQLAQNAVEHTTDGSRILLCSRIEWRPDIDPRPDPVQSLEFDPMLLLSVTDDGPGVHPDDAPHLFDRFSRGVHGRRARGGAGLGLAIVRSIAEAHGGRAYLESVPGKGATFGIAVPARDFAGPGVAGEDGGEDSGEAVLAGEREG